MDDKRIIVAFSLATGQQITAELLPNVQLVDIIDKIVEARSKVLTSETGRQFVSFVEHFTDDAVIIFEVTQLVSIVAARARSTSPQPLTKEPKDGKTKAKSTGS